MLYTRMVSEHNTAYPIPAGTRYILLTVQKTLFGLEIIPETILLQLMENGFNLGGFRKMKRQGLPPNGTVFITPVIRPPVFIAKPSIALATPQPVSIPELPVLTTPQILLPDPPPELTTPLEQIPDPPVQIHVFQPPVQISPVPTSPPVQIPDPTPELTTPLLRIPPVPMTPPVKLYYQIHHLCRSFYQIHHLWLRLLSRTLWTTLL
ncbi:hypothetical protein TNCV_1368161 [Trichonephila clavipes]|nr:hypothetical protein TNCV_1368161 [Trichonephila clavipes]